MGTKSPECEPTCKALTSLEGRVEGVIRTLGRMDKELNGNGQPGFRQDIAAIRETLAAIAATSEAKLNEVSKQIGHKTLLWTAAGVALTAAGLMVMCLTIWVMVKLANHSEINFPKFGVSYSEHEAYSAHRIILPQTADLPSSYDRTR